MLRVDAFSWVDVQIFLLFTNGMQSHLMSPIVVLINDQQRILQILKSKFHGSCNSRVSCVNLLTAGDAVALHRKRSDEEHLLGVLFSAYNQFARPVLNSSSTVMVAIQFSLMHIKDLVSLANVNPYGNDNVRFQKAIKFHFFYL